MKLLTILTLVVVLVNSEFVVHTPTQLENYNIHNYSAAGLFDISINKQVDFVLDQVRIFLVENGFDPTNLPNHVEEFSVQGMLTHHGRLSLTKGWLQDLRTIARSGDATFRMQFKAHIKIPIIIPNLEFGYDYKVKFGLARRSGGIIGTVEHYRLFVYALFDVVHQKITFKQFDTTDIGEIKVKLTGKVWSDWWMNAFISAVTQTIHDDIVKVVNTTVAVIADKVADVINNKRYSVYPGHFLPAYDINS